MAIGSASESGMWVVVYNERGGELFRKSGNLIGYTSSSATIEQNGWSVTYDDRGGEKFRKRR